MEKPRLKPHVAVVPVSPGNLLLRGPALFVRYGGEAVPTVIAVAKLLDGTRTPAEVVRDSGLPADDVREVLEALAADRVLEDAAEDEKLALDDEQRRRLDPQLQLLSHLTARPARAQNRISEARVVVLGGGACARHVAEGLAASGVGRVETPEVGDLTRLFADDLRALLRGATHAVLALDRPLPVTLLATNEACLAEGLPWTSVVLDGLEASVGPTVIPGQTACWRCYDLRVKGAHPNLERLLAYEAALREPPRAVGLPSFAQAAGAFAAQSLVLTLSGVVLPPLAGWVLRVGLLDLHAERHRVLRIPRCPACSGADVPDVDRYALEPVRLS